MSLLDAIKRRWPGALGPEAKKRPMVEARLPVLGYLAKFPDKPVVGFAKGFLNEPIYILYSPEGLTSEVVHYAGTYDFVPIEDLDGR